MKILVTGGAGFIGSQVVDGYLEEGHQVVVVDNMYSGRYENLNPGASFYLMDIRSELLGKVFARERPDVVNHHAAQMSVPASMADPSFDAQVNILGLINLLECSVKHGVQKVVFISSGGAVYGESDIVPTPETCPPRPLSPYAITKLCSEHYLACYRHHYGLRFTILRYANVYGPRQIPHGEAGVVSIFMSALAEGRLPAIYHYPEEPEGMARDYCYVKDIVRANMLALGQGDGDVFNIGTGRQTNTATLYRAILQCLRTKGLALDGTFDNPPKGPARPGDLRRSCLDITRAVKMLQWHPEYDLERGIAETVAACVKTGNYR